MSSSYVKSLTQDDDFPYDLRVEKQCLIDNCEMPARSRGYCNIHYMRWYQYGDPLAGGPLRSTVTTLNRFHAGYIINPETGCWNWTKKKTKGYGALKINGKTVSAHRFAYLTFIGPIPNGYQLDHFECNNPPCCNPYHLRATTPRENTLRSNAISAQNARKTHCCNGHEFNQANTRIVQTNSGIRRICKVCAREYMRARRLRLSSS